MSRVQTKYLQRKERKQKIIIIVALILINSLVLNINLLATLVYLIIVSALRWRQTDKNYLVGFWLMNLLFYPITSDSTFLCGLVSLASLELIYLGGSSKIIEATKNKDNMDNIIELMSLNNSVVSTVFDENKRYDFNVHNGNYEEKNIVNVSMSEQYVTDFINNNIVKTKQMLGVKELSGTGLFNVMHLVDLRDLRTYRRSKEVSRVCEIIEQEQFIFKSYVDNRVELTRKQLQDSYSLSSLDEISVVDYTQEIMSNKIKAEQRFRNLQTLVDQLVLKLKNT